jgi:hypothetical protein
MPTNAKSTQQGHALWVKWLPLKLGSIHRLNQCKISIGKEVSVENRLSNGMRIEVTPMPSSA